MNQLEQLAALCIGQNYTAKEIQIIKGEVGKPRKCDINHIFDKAWKYNDRVVIQAILDRYTTYMATS